MAALAKEVEQRQQLWNAGNAVLTAVPHVDSQLTGAFREAGVVARRLHGLEQILATLAQLAQMLKETNNPASVSGALETAAHDWQLAAQLIEQLEQEEAHTGIVVGLPPGSGPLHPPSVPTVPPPPGSPPPQQPPLTAPGSKIAAAFAELQHLIALQLQLLELQRG